MAAPKNETALLDRYHRSIPPRAMYLEVGIGGGGSPWSGSTQRRIDGVVVEPSGQREMKKKRAFARDREAGGWTAVDLLEAKASLSEAVVGQLLCARAMWLKQHEIPVRNLIAVYRHEDPAMKTLAGELGIDLHRVMPKNANAPLRLRPRFRLSAASIAAVGAYRDAVGGRFVIRVPLTGDENEVPNEKVPAATFANFVRLQDDGRDLPLALMEDEAAFREVVKTKAPEVVIQATELSRGRIGKAVCQARFFEQRYGVRPKMTIVCGKADSALRWVCDAGLGELGPVGVWTPG